MKTVKISDSFGFADDIQVSEKGSLTKYFRPLPNCALGEIDLKNHGGESLEKIGSKHATVNAGTTIEVGSAGSVDLSIKAGGSGEIALFAPGGDKPACLFDPDQFADAIEVAPSQRYVSVGFGATVAPELSDKTGDLKFGFKASSGIKLTYFQLFDLTQSAPTLLEAIKSTIGNFTIPGDLDDVEAMPVNSIASVNGTGNVKFSGRVSMASLTNAPVSMPVGPVSPVQITAGGKISVGAEFELSGEYQVRIHRLAGKSFRMGLYRKRNTEFTLTASASEGVSVEAFGQGDLFSTILGAISKDPKADKDALAGLSKERIADIQKVIQQAVDRTLNIGVTNEIGFGSESEAMFLYEVDLGVISDEGRPLVHAALEGDLRPLVSSDQTPPTGMKVLKSVISSTKTLRHALKVNLLGIYNAARVSELTLKGTMAWDALTGELILTDTATASTIGISAVNFAADSKKLYNVLSEQFLISAACMASGGVKTPPGLKAQHTYFDFSSRTSRTEVRKDLELAVAFKLASEASALAKLPAGVNQFGASTVLAEAAYGNAAAEALFLNNNRPRDPLDYEIAGKNAIAYLVQKGDVDDCRLLPLLEPALWAGMKENGDVTSIQFVELVRKYSQAAGAPQLLGTDFANIVWWRDTMRGCAQALVGVRDFVAKHPGTDPNNHDFVALKRGLANDLKKVAGKTKEDFGGPWGLIAMFLLVAGGTPKLTIRNRYMTLSLEKELSVGA